MKLPFVNLLKTGGAIIAGSLLFIGMVVCYFALTSPPDSNSVSGDETPAANIERHGGSVNSIGTTLPEKKGVLSVEGRLVQQLKDQYENTITEISTQVLLLKFKRNLLKKFPEKGNIMFESIIKIAFPDTADAILKTLTAMENYLTWEKENQELLAQMNILEKQGLLWKKRQELFGDDAQDIWSEEIMAHEERKQQVRNTISRLNASYDSSLYEKLDEYQDTLKYTYDGTPEAHILKNKDLLSKVFFGLESVQAELSDMEPVQRTLEIDKIRNELGFSQKQIEELRKLDNYRNKRWENGLAYMEERDLVVQNFTGTERETNLQSLRERYFKHEAKTIEIEENDGFYRFERTRIYGRN